MRTMQSEVLSILGMLALNTMFLEINWGIITNHEEYVPFPVEKVRITQWWKLNANWEAR